MPCIALIFISPAFGSWRDSRDVCVYSCRELRRCFLQKNALQLRCTAIIVTLATTDTADSTRKHAVKLITKVDFNYLTSHSISHLFIAPNKSFLPKKTHPSFCLSQKSFQKSPLSNWKTKIILKNHTGKQTNTQPRSLFVSFLTLSFGGSNKPAQNQTWCLKKSERFFCPFAATVLRCSRFRASCRTRKIWGAFCGRKGSKGVCVMVRTKRGPRRPGCAGVFSPPGWVLRLSVLVFSTRRLVFHPCLTLRLAFLLAFTGRALSFSRSLFCTWTFFLRRCYAATHTATHHCIPGVQKDSCEISDSFVTRVLHTFLLFFRPGQPQGFVQHSNLLVLILKQQK